MQDEDKLDARSQDALGPIDRWQYLLDQQTSLFKATASANEELLDKVAQLEKELGVWKLAYDNAVAEKDQLKKEVGKLERNIGSLKDNNSTIVALIDGDGNIFHPDLLQKGQAGGRLAANQLTRGIMDYMESLYDPNPPALQTGHIYSGSGFGRPNILVAVYCNATGLADVLVKQQVCDKETFQAFCIGFNQASPLFSIVDAGTGKEAADSKIKECLRLYSRFPQTTKIFFGGSHDNGYTSTLTSLENEGHLYKVVLLMGYKESAAEIRTLNIPTHEISGLFTPQKFTSNSKHFYAQQQQQQQFNLYNTNNNDNGNPSFSTDTPPSGMDNNDTMGSPSKHQHYKRPSYQKDQTSSYGSSPRSNNNIALPNVGNPNAPSNKHKTSAKKPCNWHFIHPFGCSNGDKCRFSHDADVTSEQLQIMRDDARKTPCPIAKRKGSCRHEACPFSHICPSGSTCKFYIQGSCKYSAKEMHEKPNFVGSIALA